MVMSQIWVAFSKQHEYNINVLALQEEEQYENKINHHYHASFRKQKNLPQNISEKKIISEGYV